MVRLHKNQQISAIIGRQFKDLLVDLYVIKKYSAREVSDWIFSNTSVKITTRSIQRFLNTYGVIRSYSKAFKNAINRGAKTYDKLRKPIKSSAYRKGISLAVRYQIFKRDLGKCQLCGKTASDDAIVVDHIVPVVMGGDNDISNLRLLCRQCNHGKMLFEEKI